MRCGYSYPIDCYKEHFNNSSELEEYINETLSLLDKPQTLQSMKDRYFVIEYCYDKGFLNHPDYKHLINCWPRK